MANEMRDRLVELLLNGEKQFFDTKANKTTPLQSYLSNYLIENGVVVPPCKVDDTVYYLDGSTIVESKVHCISFGGRYGDYKGGQIHIYDSDKDNITVKLDNFGKTVFLTKSEAEQKLKEMRGEKDA